MDWYSPVPPEALTPTPKRLSLRLPTTEPLHDSAKSFLDLALDARVPREPLGLPAYLWILEHIGRAPVQLGKAAPSFPLLAFVPPNQGVLLRSSLFTVIIRGGSKPLQAV